VDQLQVFTLRWLEFVTPYASLFLIKIDRENGTSR
jgi:hypothetical protein